MTECLRLMNYFSLSPHCFTLSKLSKSKQRGFFNSLFVAIITWSSWHYYKGTELAIKYELISFKSFQTTLQKQLWLGWPRSPWGQLGWTSRAVPKSSPLLPGWHYHPSDPSSFFSFTFTLILQYSRRQSVVCPRPPRMEGWNGNLLMLPFLESYHLCSPLITASQDYAVDLPPSGYSLLWYQTPANLLLQPKSFECQVRTNLNP